MANAEKPRNQATFRENLRDEKSLVYLPRQDICENIKTKQRRAATADELMIFPNTHEAIVDQDTWNIAHKLRLRKRPKAANGT